MGGSVLLLRRLVSAALVQHVQCLEILQYVRVLIEELQIADGGAMLHLRHRRRELWRLRRRWRRQAELIHARENARGQQQSGGQAEDGMTQPSQPAWSAVSAAPRAGAPAAARRSTGRAPAPATHPAAPWSASAPPESAGSPCNPPDDAPTPAVRPFQQPPRATIRKFSRSS